MDDPTQFVINRWSDRKLRFLRKHPGDVYQIPHGGNFAGYPVRIIWGKSLNGLNGQLQHDHCQAYPLQSGLSRIWCYAHAPTMHGFNSTWNLNPIIVKHLFPEFGKYFFVTKVLQYQHKFDWTAKLLNDPEVRNLLP